MKHVRENFIRELERLEVKYKVLLIPLGRAVEEVLLTLSEEGILNKEQILIGFPHPSGANVNRVIQLEENKEQMKELVKGFSL